MKFFNALKNDIRFQIKYGFYFLYAFFSLIYMAVLWIMPSEYKNMTASLIILTDPAMLGIFFIGGIWLLEKREGLHRFLEHFTTSAAGIFIVKINIAGGSVNGVGRADRSGRVKGQIPSGLFIPLCILGCCRI